MSITPYIGSSSISTSEFSLPNSTVSGVPVSTTTRGRLTGEIDFSAMASGDVYLVKIYVKVNGTFKQAMPTATIVGTQDESYKIPELGVGEDWDVTVTKSAGTTRTIGWSLHVFDESMSTTTIAAAVAAFVNDSAAPANAQTIQQILNIIVSACAAVGTGLASDGSVVIKNTANTKTRIAGTVASGARSGVTLDGTP